VFIPMEKKLPVDFARRAAFGDLEEVTDTLEDGEAGIWSDDEGAFRSLIS